MDFEDSIARELVERLLAAADRAMEEALCGTTSTAPVVPPNLSMETLRQTIRELDAAEADRELNLFLSDAWPVHKILKQGGRIIEVNGVYYAISGLDAPFGPRYLGSPAKFDPEA